MQCRTTDSSEIFKKRRAGILLHPTSLPASEHDLGGCGTLGPAAYQFVDFMAASGLTIWQMLPVGPTHSDRSPYQSLSAHAGSAELISIDWLVEQGWLHAADLAHHAHDRTSVLHLAATRFFQANQTESEENYKEENYKEENYKSGEGDRHRDVYANYRQFCKAHSHWLNDFALFQALRAAFQSRAWNKWPREYVIRDKAALAEFSAQHRAAVNYYYFEQFVFHQQWQQLRQYARDRGIFFFGDMPIFVAHDSADVWANQQFFNLDEDGNPRTVAGVPPDYFSETGQHWGNPHYHWEAIAATGFEWWLARLGSQLQLFDLIRIDHFRGFEAFWEIPGDSKDARQGRWVKAPGHAFLRACYQAFPGLPLVAENLGVITREVEALRREFNLPGMLVLQFAFDGHPDNPHLPHHHTKQDVIYTGTHDNDTTLGWYETLSAQERTLLSEYYAGAADGMPWTLIKSALASVSKMTIVPLQDWLALGGEHRMNMPGTTKENWTWQFDWHQVPNNLAHKIHHLLWLYDRLPDQQKSS